MRQSPTAFEFNEDLIMFIAVHAYSRWFPDFSCNSDRERQQFVTEGNSIWCFIEAQQNCFKNAAYYTAKASSEVKAKTNSSGESYAAAKEEGESEENEGESEEENEEEKTEGPGEGEQLIVKCGDVIFWQSFFRGGFIPIENSGARKYSSAELVQHCHVERFDPNEGNVLATLQGTHPGGKLHASESGASLRELGSGKTRSLLPSSRARRLSVLETLRDSGEGKSDAGGGAIAPTSSGRCCTVQ